MEVFLIAALTKSDAEGSRAFRDRVLDTSCLSKRQTTSFFGGK